jgi:hypothetical protein
VCRCRSLQYKLTLAEELQLEPAGSSRSRLAAEACEATAASAAAPCRGTVSRLSSWGAEAAAEAAVAAAAAAARRRAAAAGAAGSTAAGTEELGVDCFAELQYQARVKGFMQPRRMRVLLPHPSQLFFDQALPHLSRRQSENERGSAAAAAASPANAGPAAGDAPVPGPASSGRLGRLLSRRGSGGGCGGAVLRTPRTVPADAALEPVVLQNKAPHWNEGLRCWCLNFRGRVKLASVKNFQVRAAAAAAAPSVPLPPLSHPPPPSSPAPPHLAHLSASPRAMPAPRFSCWPAA